MTKQFSVIITEKKLQRRTQLKNRYENITEKADTYFKTGKQAILLKPPRRGELRGYDADVVVNETGHTNLSKIPAKPDATMIDADE